jgi:hypothetical protein
MESLTHRDPDSVDTDLFSNCIASCHDYHLSLVFMNANAGRKLPLFGSRGFNRPFRNPVKHIKGCIMEKLLNLIWVGASLAAVGPDGFKYLWQKLSHACAVYLCTHTPAEGLLKSAEWSILSYLRRVQSSMC